MSLNLGELSATITMDNKKAFKSMDATELRMKGFVVDTQGRLRTLSGRFATEGEKAGVGFGNGVERGARPGLARLQSVIQGLGKAALPTLLAGAAGAAVYLTAALLPAAGAIAALPAAAVAAKIAMVTLSMALEGVGDALGASLTGDAEKFNEKLKELPPTTRAVVKEIGGALNGLQKSTQEAFFKPMKGAAKGLAADLKGPLKAGFADVADSLGGIGAEVLKFAKTGQNIAFMKTLFAGVGSAIDGVRSGVKPLLNGIRDLIGVFIPGMGDAGQSIGDAMTKWGLWMSEISRSGDALSWFNDAKKVLKDLWGIGKNVASIITGIFGAADGGNLLATIEAVTGELAKWVNSAEGQEQLRGLFSALGQIATALLAILPGVGGALMLIAEAFNALPAPVQSGIAGLLAFTVIAKGLGGILGPTIGAIGSIGSAAGKLTGALKNPESGLRKFGSTVGSVASRAGSAMKSGATAVGSAFASMGSAAASGAGKMKTQFTSPESGLRRFAASAGQAASRVGTAMLTAATTVGRAALSMVVATGKAIAGFARMAISAAAAAARVVAGWVLMGIQSLIQAARMAIAWVIGLGPIAWIVAAVVAIVALVIYYWDEICSFLEASWEWIKSAAQAAWQWLVDTTVGALKDLHAWILSILIGIRDFFVGAWRFMVDGAIAAFAWVNTQIQSALNFLHMIIMTVLTGIVSFFQGSWQFLVDIVVGAWQWIVDTVGGALTAVVEFVASGIKSVVDWFAEIGLIPDRVAKWFGQMVDGAVAKFKALISWARGLPGKVLSALGNIGSKLLNAGKNLIDGLLRGMKNAWSAVKNWILGALKGIKNAVMDFFGISSPSKLFMWFGEMIGSGLAKGMQAASGLVNSASNALNSSILSPDPDLSVSRSGTVTMRLSDEDRRLFREMQDKNGNQTINAHLHGADNRFDLNDMKRQVAMVAG